MRRQTRPCNDCATLTQTRRYRTAAYCICTDCGCSYHRYEAKPGKRHPIINLVLAPKFKLRAYLRRWQDRT